jgi:hypothetical protein
MDNFFYTYAYLREDKTPYYIGKGYGDRAYRKHKKHRIKVPPANRILILKQNLTEGEAFRHETYMIGIFGRKDNGTGILRNRTNGGEGVVGRIVSLDERARIGRKVSVSLVGNARKKGKKEKEETRLKKSAAHTGMKATEEHRQSISRALKGRVMSDTHKKKLSEAKRGAFYWVNSEGKIKRSKERPGPEWQRGRKWRPQ